MRCRCPHCYKLVRQTRNREGPNFCSSCKQLFDPPAEEQIPSWVLGVLVFLTANLQIHWHMMMCHP